MTGEEIVARHVIDATGILTNPKMPDIPGVETFAGTTLHTARWDHSVDLRGKRVGVIGTGASAVQVIPAIAAEVEHLTVFQRTPIWCLPKLDRPIPAGCARGAAAGPRQPGGGPRADPGLRRGDLPARRALPPWLSAHAPRSSGWRATTSRRRCTTPSCATS